MGGGVLGVVLSEMIDGMVERVSVVGVMLIGGGIFMVLCEKILGKGREKSVLREKRWFFIGLLECICMIGGV